MPQIASLQHQERWWEDRQTRQEIETIYATQETQKEQLQFQREKFNQVLAMYKKAFGEYGKGAKYSVPSEFQEMVGLYQPGGQFGAGGMAEVERGGQQAIAAGQLGLASTGMSSGTNVAGLQARVYAEKAMARKKIEDERVALLGGALGQAGQASLEAQRLEAARRESLLRSLSSFNV